MIGFNHDLRDNLVVNGREAVDLPRDHLVDGRGRLVSRRLAVRSLCLLRVGEPSHQPRLAPLCWLASEGHLNLG